MATARTQGALATPSASRARPLVLAGLAVGLVGFVLGVAQLVNPFAALALPPALAILVAALRDYRVSTWILVFMLPIAPTNLVPHELLGMSGANLLHILLAISVSSLVLTYALHPRRLALPSWPRSFFLYLGVFVAAAIHGSLYYDSIPDFLVVLKVVSTTSVQGYLQVSLLNPLVALGAAVVLAIAVRNANRPALYLVPIFCSAAVFAGAIFVVAMTSGSSLNDLASADSRNYLSSTGLHANELGLMLNMAFALALFSCVHATRMSAKVALAGVAALMVGGVLLTFSRGSYLGSLTVVAYLLVVQRKFVVFAVAVLLLPLAVLLMPESVTQRATHEVGGNDVDALSSGRVDEIWQPLVPEVLASPLVGRGLGSILWSDANRQHKILPVGHPHSAYIGALLDLGVLGTIAVFIFFHHAWRLFSRLGAAVPERLWRGFFRGGAACVLVLLVQGATDDSFLPSRTHSFLWVAYGLAIGFAARLRARGRPDARSLARPILAATVKANTR